MKQSLWIPVIRLSCNFTKGIRFNLLILHLQLKGRVAEWLGRGLQNLVQQFESARDLEGAGKFSSSFFMDLNTSELHLIFEYLWIFKIGFWTQITAFSSHWLSDIKNLIFLKRLNMFHLLFHLEEKIPNFGILEQLSQNYVTVVSWYEKNQIRLYFLFCLVHALHGFHSMCWHLCRGFTWSGVFYEFRSGTSSGAFGFMFSILLLFLLFFTDYICSFSVIGNYQEWLCQKFCFIKSGFSSFHLLFNLATAKTRFIDFKMSFF